MRKGVRASLRTKAKAPVFVWFNGTKREKWKKRRPKQKQSGKQIV